MSKPAKKWKPIVGEKYYYIAVDEHINDANELSVMDAIAGDFRTPSTFNMFSTKSEATAARRLIIAILKGETP